MTYKEDQTKLGEIRKTLLFLLLFLHSIFNKYFLLQDAALLSNLLLKYLALGAQTCNLMKCKECPIFACNRGLWPRTVILSLKTQLFAQLQFFTT